MENENTKLDLLSEKSIPHIKNINENENLKHLYAPIAKKDEKKFEVGIKAIQKYIREETFSDDIATFVPKLIPIYRRVFPFLIAKGIVGYQPMDKPAQQMFAIRNHYTNDAVNPITQDATSPQTSSKILKLSSTSGLSEGDTITGQSSGATGTIRHLENGAMGYAILVEVDSGTFEANEAVNSTSGAPTISAVYDNEAGYNYFLSNYAGTYTTAQAEALSTSMKEMGITVDSKNVEAVERWLKATYSPSSAQDLKAVHGLDMDEELSNIMAYEITQNINRAVIDSVLDNAETSSLNADLTNIDARWQGEKMKYIYTHLTRKANDIAIATRRGPGNFIIGSSDVITALESLNTYAADSISNSLDTMSFDSAYKGKIGNRFNVYLDSFAQNDYGCVGYKGMSEFDAGVIYSPYVPLQVYRGMGESDAKPRIFFQSRDAITTSIMGVSNYYRKVNITNIF